MHVILNKGVISDVNVAMETFAVYRPQHINNVHIWGLGMSGPYTSPIAGVISLEIHLSHSLSMNVCVVESQSYVLFCGNILYYHIWSYVLI